MSDPTIPPASPDPVPPTPDYASPTTPGPGGLFTPPIAPVGLEMNPEARQWGMIAHLSALVGFVIPFGNIIGPLVVWQMKKDLIPFAGDQGKEALNFNISIAILLIICLALMCVVVGFVLLPIVGIFSLVMTILAAIAANKGEYYRYPFTIRLIK